jgi:hypothetical protein
MPVKLSSIILLSFFCLCTGSICAQHKIIYKTDWLGVNKTLFAPVPFNPVQAPAPQLKSMLCVKAELPKLAFFCSMEDKFRNRFNVFLKLRAGTDEAYMKMITACDR